MDEQDYTPRADRAIAEAFGRPELASPVVSRPAAVAAFRAAGFQERDAEKGAQMLESGIYIGFADVATTLEAFSLNGGTALVTPFKVAEAAKSLEAQVPEVREAREAREVES